MTNIIRSVRSSMSGFSLVELMTTIAIASTLATMAVPSYLQMVRKSRRLEARIAVLNLAAREERFFSTNSAYTALPTDLGYSGTFPQVIGGGYYQITVCVAANLPCNADAAVTGNAFLITATHVGTQTSDAQCASFSIDSTGAQTATGTGATTCWR